MGQLLRQVDTEKRVLFHKYEKLTLKTVKNRYKVVFNERLQSPIDVYEAANFEKKKFESLY